MWRCSRCGYKMADDVSVCLNCGSQMNDDNVSSKRVQEYAGKIIKCPSCGEELSSFTAICPACGHEINSAEVPSAIKEFTDKINQCDMAIASSPLEPKKGWKSWGRWKKIGWVLLNIYTLCIPLVIYLLFPLLGVGRTSMLTPDEKIKAQFITNYPFPNDREHILEALLYIKAQINTLASGKIDRNTFRWIKIWKGTASQLHEKAEIMFKGDNIANGAYSSILADEQKVKKTLLARVIIAVIIVVLFAGIMLIRSGRGKSIIEETATFEWPSNSIAMQVPKPPSDKGKITFNDDEMFWLEVYGINESQYESYIAECKNRGFSIEGEKDSISYQAYNEEGYFVQLLYLSSREELSIHVEAPQPMSEVQWPKSDIAKRLPVPKSSYGNIYWEADYGFVIYLGNTSKKDFWAYADACYDAGFTVDYEKGDTYFRADDSEGYHVNVEYRGNDVMFIRLDDPD